MFVCGAYRAPILRVRAMPFRHRLARAAKAGARPDRDFRPRHPDRRLRLASRLPKPRGLNVLTVRPVTDPVAVRAKACSLGPVNGSEPLSGQHIQTARSDAPSQGQNINIHKYLYYYPLGSNADPIQLLDDQSGRQWRDLCSPALICPRAHAWVLSGLASTPAPSRSIQNASISVFSSSRRMRAIACIIAICLPAV